MHSHSPRPSRRLANLLALMGVVGGLTLAPLSLAHFRDLQLVPTAEGATPSALACPINKRFENFDAVIKNGISSGDFMASWADIFARNACQRDDIFSLQKALESAQNQLRQKVFSCQTGSAVQALSQQINDLKFELEYVRNVIDTDEEQPSPDGAKGVVRSPAALRELLQDTVVVQRGLVDTSRFSKLFETLQTKYAPRVDAYINCKDENWEALRDSWNTFTDSWAGLSPAWKKTKQVTETKMNALTSPVGKTGLYLSGFLDVRLNNLTPQQTLTNIAAQLQKNSGKGGATPDFLNILSKSTQDLSRYDREKDIAERKARYEVLYKEFGDNAAYTMLTEVKSLNTAITDTLPVADKIRACTQKVAERQCDGK